MGSRVPIKTEQFFKPQSAAIAYLPAAEERDVTTENPGRDRAHARHPAGMIGGTGGPIRGRIVWSV